ncbi:SDR family oxidoreductase [Metabacillus sp. GX 13764]|uniref:SDR family oxidoreductase n=1 Tax=Metabacillus kandeliae TaxID=2900151 RepID=UPI001E482729|nr:SDR family oxidoreductase [Metabacillus kandeliae]MCD7036135.1 SDR family oxidoreductase [Metabacillus kandeliae]
MKVLVAGAHGTTGKHIVKKLAAKGHEPIAMIRDESQSEELESLGAKTVIGDLEGDVTEAVKGTEAVIFAAGSGGSTGEDKTIAVDQEGAKKLIDAAKHENVRHFTMLSSMGADIPEEQSGAMATYLKAKAIADEYLMESEIPYTIVRPGPLTDDPETGKIMAETSLGQSDGEIPREDVAEVLVQSLENEYTKNLTFEILSGNLDINEALRNLFE